MFSKKIFIKLYIYRKRGICYMIATLTGIAIGLAISSSPVGSNPILQAMAEILTGF